MKEFFKKLKENKNRILSNVIMLIFGLVLTGICQTLDNTLTTFNIAFLFGMFGYDKGQAYLEAKLDK